MKKMLFVYLSFLVFCSCSDSNKDIEPICTEEFVTISLKIQDEDGSPVALDSFKVVLGDRNITEEIYSGVFDLSLYQKYGLYPLFNDALRREFEGRLEKVVFFGYMDDKEVVKDTFRVTANECHVYYPDPVTKPLLIILEK